jgi:hypothetical protein
MAKLGMFASVVAFVASIAFAVSSTPAESGDPCRHKEGEFKTQMIKEACAKGGQSEAKDQMKAFMKTAKVDGKAIKSCNECHANLAPKYELKPDGLTEFGKAGGKLLEEKPASK